MLLDEIKKQMFAAMKAGNSVEKEILRVAVGEITTEEARGVRQGDELAISVLKKLVKSNQESMEASSDDAQKKTLSEEIEVLSSFLPKTLGEAEVIDALADVVEAIKEAKNDGQATGVAMKKLKSTGASVDGKVVAAAVKKIRA